MNFQTAGIMNLSLLELGGQEGDARNLTAAQVTTSNVNMITILGTEIVEKALSYFGNLSMSV